jgi:glycosyltransferase involved in cell wall biosynthesis
MRVLIIESAGNLWGSERALLDLIDGMPTLEFAVCCPPETPLIAELQHRSISVLPFFIANLHLKSKSERLKAAIGVLRACLSFRPHLIHLNQSGCFKIASIAANLLRLPIVAHVRIFEDAEYLARQQPKSTRLAGIIAISKSIEVEVQHFAQLKQIKIHQIYDAYVPAIETQNVSLDNQLVCIGRVTPIKGQDVLIDALKLISGVECSIVGDGEPDYLNELKRKGADIVGLKWLGFIKEVMPILQTARILVCPSIREPLGRVIFEAWDAGCVPLVYVGSGGAAEIVKLSGGGVLYDEPTPDSLATAIKQVLALTPSQQMSLVQVGRDWMKENCNPRLCGDKITAVLSNACGK